MYQIAACNAKKFTEWLKSRGGVALWRSADLSRPGQTCWTPAKTEDGKDYAKPGWMYESKPEKVVTDAHEFEVCFDKEVKRFHVAVRMGSQGFSLKLTDASSARVHKEVEKAGEGAYYEFDYNDYKNCVILAPEKTIPLTEYKED